MKRKRSAVEQHFCTLQNRRHFGKWFKNKENCMELHHGKERKECERMECKSGISCEKAFLDRERSVDAFCVRMKFSCAVGKKSGRNVIKEKFVVCSSIAFLFVFFPLSSFFPSWNFLWGELPHCTKLLFLHAFTLHIRREATDWRPHLGEREKKAQLFLSSLANDTTDGFSAELAPTPQHQFWQKRRLNYFEVFCTGTKS